MIPKGNSKGTPDIDLGTCSRCLGCVELCPEVFQYNQAGYIETIDMEEYPVDCIDEAIAKCPEDSISWRKTVWPK